MLLRTSISPVKSPVSLTYKEPSCCISVFHFKGGLFACIKSCLTLLYIHCLWTPRGVIRSPLWSCSKFLPTRFYHEEDPWSRHLVDEWVSKQCDRPDTQITVCNSAEYQSRKMQHALFDVVHTSSWSWPNTTRGWWVIFVTCGMRCLWRSAWKFDYWLFMVRRRWILLDRPWALFFLALPLKVQWEGFKGI